MQILLILVIGLGLAVLGVLLQAGLLMVAANLAADKPIEFKQAVIITIVASVLSMGIQVGMALSSGASVLYSGPIGLLVWGGTISVVAEMRIGQAVFTAIGMTILQTILVVFAAASLASLALTASG